MSINESVKRETIKKFNSTLYKLRPDSQDKSEELSGLLTELVSSVSVENPSRYLETIQNQVNNDSNMAGIVELFFKPSFISNEDYQDYLNILNAESESEIKRLDLVVEISHMGYPVMKINEMPLKDLESFKGNIEGLLDAGIPKNELMSVGVNTINQLSQHYELIAKLVSYNVDLSDIVNLTPELLTEFSHHLSDLDYLLNNSDFTLKEIVDLGDQQRDTFYQNRDAIVMLVQDAHISFKDILPDIMAMDESKKDLLLGGNIDIVIEMINDPQLKIPYQALFELDINRLKMIIDMPYEFNQIIRSGVTFSDLTESPLLENILKSKVVLKLAESEMKVSLLQLEKLTTDEDKSTIILKNFQNLDYLVLDKSFSADEIIQCDPKLLEAILKNAESVSKMVELGFSLQSLINQGTTKAMLMIENADKVVGLLEKHPNLIKQPIEYLHTMLETKVSKQKQEDPVSSKENSQPNETPRRK